MIVPMKKVSLVIRENKKRETLKKLRKAGIVHIEISEASSERLSELKEQIALLESAAFMAGELKNKNTVQTEISASEALSTAKELIALTEEKKNCTDKKIALEAELERLRRLGNADPHMLDELSEKGLKLFFYEMPVAEYEALGEEIRTLVIEKTKNNIKFMLISFGTEEENEAIDRISSYRLSLPESSSEELNEEIEGINSRIKEINEKLSACACFTDSLKKAVKSFEKDVEFETFATGMSNESLGTAEKSNTGISFFTGYVEEENLEKLRETAKENCWGLLAEDPTEEDNVPTKLKNNRFVSLIYPLTDFLGTVPGYFEYDISGWFLAFILIFFGIIFGDGGYGLFILIAAAALIIKSKASKKPVPAAFLLVGLFGLSTILWGTLTCTWFGLSADKIPVILQKLSVPFISNVYADTIWYPFWSDGTAGLTTAQNLQIFCFTLALVQLTVAHIKGAVRNRKSVKLLGDIGSVFQLLGIYYLVLSLVVNAEVFSFGLVIGGVPVGTVAIALIGVGFCLSFVFANYEGNLIKSILASLTNIVSVLLGVVNVFSDIVSYIRLWAVGLAGAAIAETVNELASPFLGNLMLMVIAIILLVFGHGLNMILNVLSVIVHGIRLNTLEFSSHLDMSWSGHKFKPFKEQID